MKKITTASEALRGERARLSPEETEAVDHLVEKFNQAIDEIYDGSVLQMRVPIREAGPKVLHAFARRCRLGGWRVGVVAVPGRAPTIARIGGEVQLEVVGHLISLEVMEDVVE